jgi:hypothetical protein
LVIATSTLSVAPTRERHAAGEAVLLHRIFGAVDADRVAVGATDDGEEDRRVAGPIGRVGVGHQLAAVCVLERRELGTQWVDLRGEVVVGDRDQVGHWGPSFVVERAGLQNAHRTARRHLPGEGRGPVGKVEVTRDCPPLLPFPSWAPAFAGVVLEGEETLRRAGSRLV